MFLSHHPAWETSLKGLAGLGGATLAALPRVIEDMSDWAGAIVTAGGVVIMLLTIANLTYDVRAKRQAKRDRDNQPDDADD